MGRSRVLAGEHLAASEDPDIRNISHVSFAENLVWGDAREQPALAGLRPSFGPETEKRFREFEAWPVEAGAAELKQRNHES